MIDRYPVVVLGGGLAGLAVGMELRKACVVLEGDGVPGGLVRSHQMGEYWFDYVLHALYFRDEGVKKRILALAPDLVPNPFQAFAESLGGTARFPIQMHLGDLGKERCIEMLGDLLAARETARRPKDFAEELEFEFGTALYRDFFKPYNEKVWKRDLSDLAPGAAWTITKIDLKELLKGALTERTFAPYNADSFYPRPPSGETRCMGYLSQALAREVENLELGTRAVEIDLEARTVACETPRGLVTRAYEEALVSTLPLPALAKITRQLPSDLRDEATRLKSNGVVSIMIAVQGERPSSTGHWRYYADPEIVFSRLIFQCEFDPAAAPENGWGLLAEITYPSDDPPRDLDSLIERTLVDARKVGILRPSDVVLETKAILVDPAYVVFDRERREILQRLREFLLAYDVHLCGRYGLWDYNSMAQVISQGLTLGARLNRGRA
ncbi:MAG: protoporphyrinogen/coproporphyrinogen oxidase [Fimbriimonas sp.]